MFTALGIGAILSSTVAVGQTAMFSVKELTNLPGNTAAAATSINNAGDVVGIVSPSEVLQPQYGVIWQNGTPTLLGAVAGATQSTPVSINNAGQVVGNVQTAIGNQAVIWNNGTPTLLPSPSSQYRQTFASFLNDAGQIVGYAESGSGSQLAVVWSGLTPTELGLDGNEFGEPSGINSGGLIVGNIHNAPVVWHGTLPIKLPLNPGIGGGKALAVNNAGIIVGVTASPQTGTYSSRATAWANGSMTDLGTLSGESAAYAVNNRGIIVGKSWATGAKGPHAVVWGRMDAPIQDLNDLISATAASEVVLQGAYAINDNCTIVVEGFPRKTKVYQAFLLILNDPTQCVNGL